MADKHPVRTTIVSTVVGGIILAVVLKVAPGAWRLVTVVAGAIWGAATAPLPLWALILTAVVVWLIARRRARPPQLGRSVAELDAVSEPDDLGEAIIRRFAEADGATFTLQDLSNVLDVPKLRLDRALDELVSLGLVVGERGSWLYGTPPAIGLTQRGRDYAIQRGYVR